jgi:hypothetical protein
LAKLTPAPSRTRVAATATLCSRISFSRSKSTISFRGSNIGATE